MQHCDGKVSPFSNRSGPPTCATLDSVGAVNVPRSFCPSLHPIQGMKAYVLFGVWQPAQCAHATACCLLPAVHAQLLLTQPSASWHLMPVGMSLHHRDSTAGIAPHQTSFSLQVSTRKLRTLGWYTSVNAQLLVPLSTQPSELTEPESSRICLWASQYCAQGPHLGSHLSTWWLNLSMCGMSNLQMWSVADVHQSAGAISFPKSHHRRQSL